MKQYSFSEMNRQSGEILETALIEPVSLTKRGKEKLVILSAARYRTLTEQRKPEAHRVTTAPDHVHADLMEGLEAILGRPQTDV
jgi:prevent-host-death family protein